MPLFLQHCEQHIIPLPPKERIARVTCDGGVAEKNPSPHGGMWAWRSRTADGQIVAEASGIVLAAEVDLTPKQVTNNFTEVLAVLIALEWLPAGWAGEVRTDSLITIRCFRNLKPRVWLPKSINTRMVNAVARLGQLSHTLLNGHPTKAQVAQLSQGVALTGERGYPLCLDNHWCDMACQAAWIAHEAQVKGMTSE